MCGIIGSVSDKFRFTEHDIQVLKHRGPDDQGYFVEGNVMLGHRRLSIVDLSKNGHQPMLSADGRYVLIFNGEIYNHSEIRKELLRKGYQFRSSSDTETLLYAFVEYGESVWKKLNGIFAFAIYDRVDQLLWLVRDQFGIKPLYYYNQNGVFAFASEIKALLSIPDVDRTINYQALFYYLQLLYAPGHLTPFQEVKKVLPGHAFKFDLSTGELTTNQYFEFDFREEENGWSEKQWQDELENHLVSAVERQLMSDVPLGFFLSGGLDSSLIVAIAKKILPSQSITCFGISGGKAMQQEGFADDAHYAALVAKHLDVNLHLIEANWMIQEQFDSMVWHLDEPQADPATLHVRTICKAAREFGIKVLLGGTAGDDLFSGYRRHQAITMEKYFRWVPKPLGKMMKAGVENFKEVHPSIRRIKKLVRDAGEEKHQRLAGYFMWLSENRVMELFSRDSRQQLLNKPLPSEYYKNLLLQLPAHTSDLNKILYLELKTFLPDHNLNYTDKMSMAVSVEARVPYLDTELVNLAGRMPVALKMKGNTTKYLLRKVAEKYLPESVIYRPKTGFGAPVRHWIRHELKDMVHERLSPGKIRQRGIFDPTAVLQLIKQNEEGRIDASYTIWSMLAIESWLEQFADRTTT